MQESKWPEATAITAVAVAMTFILTPWDRVGHVDWSAVSAVGTLLAVIAALLVPMWQNADRLREQNKVSVVRRWVTAHMAYQILGRIDELLVQWKESRRPSSSEFTALHTRLNILQDRVDDIHGLSISTLIASIADSLEGFAKRYESEALIHATRSSANSGLATRFPPDVSTSELSEYQKKSERLKRNCEDWMKFVLEDADRKRIEIPGVVRAGASVSMNLSVKAEGRRKKSNETA